MYTQCPECQTAFRITAGILKQAAGRVRCGGCGKPFNALEHLSEEPPRHPGRTAEPPPPERAPTSRRMLETLDEMAGSEDIRIEDTGLEWRVLGGDEPGSLADDAAAADDPGDTAAQALVDTQTVLDFDTSTATDEEPRYDDNTPLPDDFEELQSHSATAAGLRRRAEDLEAPPPIEYLEAQHDLDLGRPEDWAGLLSEVDGPAVNRPAADAAADDDGSISLEVEEELAAIHSELSYRPGRWDAPATTATGRHRAAGRDEPPAVGLPGAVEEDADTVLLDDDDAVGDSTAVAEPADEEGSSLELVLEAGDDEDAEPTVRFAQSTGEFQEEIAQARRMMTGATPAAAASAGQPEEDAEERERTINLQIDEELLRAMGDESLAATMTGEDGSPLVETIIMEGDFIRGSLVEESQSADTASQRGLPDGASLVDTYMLTREKGKSRFRWLRPGKGTAALAALLLLLGVQYVHQSRERLATIGAFNQTLGPIYRTLGSPVRPRWDIRGWQFETTTGSTDEAGSRLTIQSRIANRSDSPLPYPLIHVSLTDRWEETIGSRVLEPNEYLAGAADPRRPVAPHENFTAVITIESPSPDAAGFKLNVCYREGPGRVRCAIEDFKD